MDLDYGNLGDLNDAEITTRMRKCNYEKYKTLVRMHLSFELDLNTDEFDLPCHEIVYEEKGKPKKWNRLSKKHKGSSGTGTLGCGAAAKGAASAGNSPTEGLHQQIDAGFLFHLQEIKDFLILEKNLTQEGLFRKTGSVSRQNELRLQIQNDKPLDLASGDYSAHDCATVFKGYLAELPEPLLTDAHYPAHLQIAPLCIAGSGTAAASTPNAAMRPPNPERQKREQHLLSSVQLLLLLLPEDNRQLLRHIVQMLHAVAEREAANKMSADNLATLFAPHLICPRQLPPEALHYVAKKMSSIISYMIARGVEIFAVPAKLATDIRAYFLERKRKKTMSPEQTLDDSISDISTVNTVYTFVDREKTAAAHTTNNTDTELAQLYAHIQSMPESSKKRRLIKQFNKQNGQGTPLQLVVMNRLKNSEATRSAKSIGDSIKKHIFHKGIMSRTPKRTTAATTPMADPQTPNYPNLKTPKLRVLFQSPAQPAPLHHYHHSNTTTASSSSTSTTVASTSAFSAASGSGSASTSSTSTACTNHTPYKLKTHPLQKSISSSSLLHHLPRPLLEAESSFAYSASSCSSDGFPPLSNKSSCSVSAPVSRQTSNDVGATSSQSAAASVSNIASSCSASFASADAGLHLASADPNSCVTPLKLISDAARLLISAGVGGAKAKTVAWNNPKRLDSELSQPCTPTVISDLRSRFRSEPNLSLAEQRDAASAECEVTPAAQKGGKMLSRQLLMKGVSMGNLKFAFNGSANVNANATDIRKMPLMRRSNDDLNAAVSRKYEPEFIEDLDDETFEDDPERDHLESDVDAENIEDEDELDAAATTTEDDDDEEDDDEDDDDDADEEGISNVADATDSTSSELPGFSGRVGGGAYQPLLLPQTSIYRNLDLITSTPSLLLGRRSMSPITKSTQRMPKSMQESIMTPRSRKPVMVLTTTLGSSDQNQTIYQTDFSSFREQDEEDSEDEEDDEVELMQQQQQQQQPPILHNEDATSLGGYSAILRRQQLLQANHSFVQQAGIVAIAAAASSEESSSCSGSRRGGGGSEKNNDETAAAAAVDPLTNNFKEYLRTRTASPVDSSFSSQPDDFGSTQEIDYLNESQLSPSLLYCLDGNQPADDDNAATESSNDDHDGVEEQQAAAVAAAVVPPIAPIQTTNRLATNPFVILNNARKRAATSDAADKSAASTSLANRKAPSSSSTAASSSTASSASASASSSSSSGHTAKSKTTDKENCESYLRSKKQLISDYPGETSF